MNRIYTLVATVLFSSMLLPVVLANAEIFVVVNNAQHIDSMNEQQISKIFPGKSRSLPGGGKIITSDRSSDHLGNKEFSEPLIKK